MLCFETIEKFMHVSVALCGLAEFLEARVVRVRSPSPYANPCLRLDNSALNLLLVGQLVHTIDHYEELKCMRCISHLSMLEKLIKP
jgi:hypothetical protein